MHKEQRNMYTLWKGMRYADAKSSEIKVRDLVMSLDCLYLPHSHYACPIFWLSHIVHKEPSAAEMRTLVYRSHSIQSNACHDTFTLALRRMLDKDVMLSAEFGQSKVIIHGNYQQCYYPGFQERSVNGTGMRSHLEKAHNGPDPLPDLGLKCVPPT
jgi:hypothetical protein